MFTVLTFYVCVCVCVICPVTPLTLSFIKVNLQNSIQSQNSLNSIHIYALLNNLIDNSNKYASIIYFKNSEQLFSNIAT